MFKQLVCMIVALAMILVSAPVEALAGETTDEMILLEDQEEIVSEEGFIDEAVSDETLIEDGKPYRVYKVSAICVSANKTGSAKLTVKTKDGSKSVTYTLKVTK